MSQVIALITARGGSKSIPRKNIKMLAGKPLIAWTIEAALQSRKVDRVLISTDDDEIAKVAQSLGVEVPFLRPSELAQDDSSHIAVVLHALEMLREGICFEEDSLLLLQPTSPCRTSDDIDNAVALGERVSADAVIGVTAVENHPYLTKRIREDGTLEDFMTSDIPYLRRQDLPPAYGINGALYLNRCRSLLAEKTFTPRRTHPYIMLPEHSLDVDTEWDFHLAELVLTNPFRSHG
jgi:CMP-N,N'-diacetyllegionaminic acid synthase